jgi:hypothetical protein
MNYINILVFVVIYLVSFVGVAIFTDGEFHSGKCTEAEYRSGFNWAKIPVINTVLLIMNLITWAVYRISFGKR